MYESNLAVWILFMSIIAWAMPMIRQANSRLFYYFYFLGISDPLSVLLSIAGFKESTYVLTFISIINFFSLKTIVVNKKVFYLATALLAIVYIFLLFIPSIYSIYYIVIIRFFILTVFLIHTLRFVAANSKLNIFHLTLLFYEATIISKMIAILNYSETALVYFIVTSLFQVLIAIWFTIFKEDNPKLHLNLRNI